MKSVDLISKNIPSLLPSDTGSFAIKLMNEYHVTHLPVVHDHHLIGLISEEDILNIHAEEAPVESLQFSLVKTFIRDHEHPLEVMRAMAQLRLTLIPVIDQHENYLGAITRESLLNYFNTDTDVLEHGGVLLIEGALKDFSLAEVVRIIESDQVKILALFSRTLEDKLSITIKVNQSDLQPIIADLNRFGYEVKESFAEPEYFSSLKDRYESLMNYLNI